ncbi:MAG: ABC transporter permease subunit [Candidatus Nezhaarchaeota archaeon]|nr:ABC transporter permease subunit [Candidatus Nezhaarchaeota archaeon]
MELMGGMPTVIYALWAAQYLAPALRDFLMAPLHGYLGFIPLFSEEPVTGYSVFTAGVAMGVATVPYVSFLMTEAYSILPSTYREACLGIGASRLETAKILLSLCRPALLASLLLGLARAMGETTIAAMTVGNSMKVTACIIASGYTVPALVASQFGDASLYVYSESALYAASLVILSAALALSFVGLSLLSRWRSRILV